MEYSPEWDQALKDLDEATNLAFNKVKDNTITMEEACQARAKIVDLKLRMGLDYREPSDTIIKGAREVYLRNWQIPQEFSDERKAICQDDEKLRSDLAADDWQRNFLVVDDQARGQYASQRIDGMAFVWLLAWLFKWYYLMAIPVFFMVLLDMKYLGQNLKEEILCQPGRIIRLCCLGTGGMLMISHSAGLAYAYDKLRRAYLADKPLGYRLSGLEETALWKQAAEPVEHFDELLEAVKASGVVAVRKPLFAASIAGLMGISLCSFGKGQMNPTACVIVQVAASPEVVITAMPEAEDTTSKHKIVPTIEKLLAAIMPQPVEVVVSNEVVKVVVACRLEPKSVFWASNRSRAPPVTVKVNDTIRGTILGCSLDEDERVVS